MNRIYLSAPDVSNSDLEALKEAFNTGWVAPVGPNLTQFESAVSKKLGRKYSLAVNSGTSALHLALIALGIKSGDRIICPSMTFAGSAFPISYCGAVPVFIDSEEKTWNMDPELVELAVNDLIKAGTPPKALILVQIYGQCAQVNSILDLCKKFNIPVIEDAAESLGATYNGKPSGSFGDISILSFNGNKIITTSGGGMLLTNNIDFLEKAKYHANQAREPVLHYEHKNIGYNYRLSNILAGLGENQLIDLDNRVLKRKKNFLRYKESLEILNGLEFMPIDHNGNPNYWLTCILIDNKDSKITRDELIVMFEKENIEVRPLWKPLHMQSVYKDNNFYGTNIAEELFNKGLCLPSSSNLKEEEITRIISLLKKLLG